ncbi:FAD-dependent oxidoreductase [Streptomyces sp. NPDC005805]|uniref:NAD(P)/FAD-dependent oxidoreductase n=1 Tax=Streptomyces sp. NPDC005805 TaxID=3157068 RepID=UPI0033FA16ED
MTSEIVVIGAGPAGARLARRLGDAARVTVVGEESHAPYNRVLLAEVLAGRYGPEVIALPGVPVRRGVRALAVDRDRRLVHCSDGAALRYDRLVLATGSNPVLPPLRGPGRVLPDGVHPFRTLDDCAALAAATAVPGTRAVVVGGGLLGVSAARALAARGAKVVLAQQGEHLMERQLDPVASALLRVHLEGLGVEVHTECRVRGLRTGGDGAVRAVVLADGFALDAEVVVLACGVRPRVGLAVDAGLDVRRGIVVDDELRTSDPRIHAIGDCAEHDGVVHGLAGPALDQADALAGVLLAEISGAGGPDAPGSGPGAAGPPAPPRYTGTRALTRLTLAALPSLGPVDGPAPEAPPGPAAAGPPPGTAPGPTGGPPTGPAPAPVPGPPPAPHPALDIAAFGDPVPRPGDDVVQLADATRGAYRKVVVREDRLVGGVLLGDLGAVGDLARAWEGDEALPASVPLLHLLTDDGGP